MAKQVIWQININHDRAAQDLLMQEIIENNAEITAISEPYFVSVNHRWFGSTGNKPGAAIYCNSQNFIARLIAKGDGYVVVKYREITYYSVYFPPSLNNEEYSYWLTRMETVVHPIQTEKMLILGDFNARSPLWDARNFNIKGEMVIDLANALNIRLLNKRYVSTCVRTQGESTVDLSWATPVTRVDENNWKIRENVITLSDHKLIEISIGDKGCKEELRAMKNKNFPSWNIRRLDENLLKASLTFSYWTNSNIHTGNEEEMAKKLETMYKLASDMAMPRKGVHRKRSTYWWNDNLKEIRKECIKVRRKIIRARRKNNSLIIEDLKRENRQLQHDFKSEISKSKRRAWKELIAIIDSDVWELPYKLVMNKLRPATVPLTESMEKNFVTKVVKELSPAGRRREPIQVDTDWNETWNISHQEMQEVIKKMGTKNKAPGPDGLWKGVISRSNGNKVESLFSKVPGSRKISEGVENGETGFT
ncbi:PREDICTED: uncharacterized protein LOC108770506 [Trachymyrmex cornetzi]|uniref:uncharacterized protein LOC108770506 n=1 Tax=Trachymyrmex cornetzi TaxID=471704 RepID=UPI00084F7A6C|nr:PREDICTED: uncharacterized protein LOC108770506 [Trachymyrmex cornetzi]